MMIINILATIGVFSIYFLLSVLSSLFLCWMFGEEYIIDFKDILSGILTIPLAIFFIICFPIIFIIKTNRHIEDIRQDITLLKKKLKIKEKKQ